MSWPELLFDTLTRRAMPETVAAAIIADPAAAREFTPRELALLTRAAGARGGLSLSSMPEDFERHPGCEHACRVALQVHLGPRRADGRDQVDTWAAWDGDPGNPADVHGLVGMLGEPVGWAGGMDWKADRLPKERRRELAAAGLFPGFAVPHRTYNKLVRVLRNLWDHCEAMDAAGRYRRLILTGRSGFACDIRRSRFLADRPAAAFIAYITARKNLRRQFSTAGRENPVDEVAQMLLTRCARRRRTDWAMIAEVWPKPEVLGRLADEDLGSLLGRWWTVMRDCSVLLAAAWPGEGTWRDGKVDPAEMAVARGMDSDRWNNTAAAYNAARAAWIACAAASGSEAMLVPFLPGKVMRLMAHDLLTWQRHMGAPVHPDTEVWARLPRPWDVINGLADCTLAHVEAACARVTDYRTGRPVDPAVSGWTAPLPPGAVARFRPTPELVHGVAVANPAWAGLLRRAGVFSGKTAAADRAVEAALLRAEAETQGMITGALPVYDQAGGYHGTTHQAGP